MEPPSHPETDHSGPGQRRAKVSGATLLLLAVIGALVILIVILHLTGIIGPAAH